LLPRPSDGYAAALPTGRRVTVARRSVSCGAAGRPAAETPAVLTMLMPAAEAARRKQPWRNFSHLRRQDPRSYPWLLASFFISTVCE